MHPKVVMTVVDRGKDAISRGTRTSCRTGRSSYESGDEIEEDEEENSYTEDEDHVHGDSDDDSVRVNSNIGCETETDDWIGKNTATEGSTSGQSHARLSSHLRSMVGKAKSLAAASSSAGSECFQELLTKGMSRQSSITFLNRDSNISCVLTCSHLISVALLISPTNIS